MSEVYELQPPAYNSSGTFKFRWYVAAKRKGYVNNYLHSDLTLQDSTKHANRWTGYFETEAEALKCINMYKYGIPWYKNL